MRLEFLIGLSMRMRNQIVPCFLCVRVYLASLFAMRVAKFALGNSCRAEDNIFAIVDTRSCS